MYGRFAGQPKQGGHNNEVAIRRGSIVCVSGILAPDFFNSYL